MIDVQLGDVIVYPSNALPHERSIIRLIGRPAEIDPNESFFWLCKVIRGSKVSKEWVSGNSISLDNLFIREYGELTDRDWAYTLFSGSNADSL